MVQAETQTPAETQTATSEWIAEAVIGEAEVTYQRPGSLAQLAENRELLASTRYQICIGADPAVSARTPICVIPQLESMKRLSDAEIEPPSLLILQSALWQLYENKTDSQGKKLDELELRAGAASSLALIKATVDRFYPQLSAKVHFAWLPYNAAALNLIDAWTSTLADSIPSQLKQKAQARSADSDNSLRYIVRHALSYGILSPTPVIGTGGVTEAAFQQVAQAGDQLWGASGTPLALMVYPTFGASYYFVRGEPSLSEPKRLKSYTDLRVGRQLKTVVYLPEGEAWPKTRLTAAGQRVTRELQWLQRQTQGAYRDLLIDFSQNGVMGKTDPQARFAAAIRFLTGWQHLSDQEIYSAWISHSQDTCQACLGWPGN